MIRVADIQRAVAEHYGVDPAVMREPDSLGSRKPTRVLPRWVAMFICRELGRNDNLNYRYSLSNIGRSFGGRNHATVIHGIRQVRTLMEQDHNFKDEVTTLRREMVPTCPQISPPNREMRAFVQLEGSA